MRKLVLGLLGPLSLGASCVAQSVLRAGTTLVVDPGTTVAVPDGLTLSIEPNAVLVNNGHIAFAPLALLDEPPGWPVRGDGSESVHPLINDPALDTEPAGLGFVLTTATAPGQLDLERGHTSYTDTMGRVSLLRWYRVVSSVASGLDATVRCAYDTTEFNGIPEGNLQLFLRQGADSLWYPLPSGLNMVQKEASVAIQDSLGTYAFFDGTIGTLVHAEPIVISTTLVVFPSPTSMFLEVRSEGTPLRWVEILDAGGKVMFRTTSSFATSTLRIDVQALRSGEYLLRTDDGRTVRFVRS